MPYLEPFGCAEPAPGFHKCFGYNMFTQGDIWCRARKDAFTPVNAIAQSTETKDVNKLTLRCTSQQPFGDDVSAYTRCAAA